MPMRSSVVLVAALTGASLAAAAAGAQAPEAENSGFAERFFYDQSSGQNDRNASPASRALRGLLISPAEAAPAQTAEQPEATREAAQPEPPPAIAAEQTPSPPARKRLLARGRAAFYEHSGRTASGEPYQPDDLTAAHLRLPFGKRVEVVNLRTGKSVVVRINDRMPRKANKKFVIDLSRGSARAVGMYHVDQVALYAVD